MHFLTITFIAAVASPAQAAEAPSLPASGPATSGWSAPVAWGDIDGDGHPDLFVAGLGRANRFYLADGAGGFDVVPGDFSPEHSARGALFEHLDGDGFVDLVTVDADGVLRLHRGAGNALFEDSVQISSEASLTRARFYDFDGDGRADLHAETSPGRPVLFHRHGPFAFAPVALDLGEAATPTSEPGAPLGPDASGASPAARAAAPGGSGGKTSPPMSVSSSRGASGSGVATPTGVASSEASSNGQCALGIEDAGNPGACLSASIVPTLGALYPLSNELFVDLSGSVGIGTTAPSERLTVMNGDLRVEGGDVFLYDALGVPAMELNSSDGGFGSQALLYNDSANIAVELDADFAGSGDGFLALSNQNVKNTIFLDGGQNDDGGEITIGNASGAPALVLDGDDAGSGSGRVGMFNTIGVETLRLQADGSDGAGVIQLDNSLGENTIQLDGSSSSGTPFLWFRDSGFLTVEIDGGADGGGEVSVHNDTGRATVLLDGEEGDGGSVRLFNDAGLQTVDFDGDDTGDARVVLSNEFGSSKITFDAGASDDGADVTYEAADDSNTIFFDADGENNGGVLSVRNDTSEETVRIVGDEGPNATGQDSGEIYLFDRNGANNHTGISLGARAGDGAGGELFLSDSVGGITAVAAQIGRAFGDADTGPVINLLQGDNSIEFLYVDNVLTLYDDDQNATITYDAETGSKNAVMQTASHGQRLLYVKESSEVWFEDFGEGRLVDGSARIDLDPVFLETITVDAANPMSVYVTPTGPSPGVWIETGVDHFVVHELDGGNGEASFDWRLVAKRRGLEDARLEPFADPALTFPIEALQASRGAPSFTDVEGEAQDDPVEHAPAPEAAEESRSEAKRAPEIPVEGATKSSKEPAEGS